MQCKHSQFSLCLQVVKSLQWIENDEKLVKQFERRLRRGSRFVKGDLAALKTMVEETRRGRIVYRLVVVQPGISHAKMDDLSVLLASTGGFVEKSRGQQFEVWCSA